MEGQGFVQASPLPAFQVFFSLAKGGCPCSGRCRNDKSRPARLSPSGASAWAGEVLQALDKGAGQGVNPGTLPVPYGFPVLGAGQMAAGGMRRGDHLPRMVQQWLPMGWKHRTLLQFPAPPVYVAAGYCLIEIDYLFFSNLPSAKDSHRQKSGNAPTRWGLRHRSLPGMGVRGLLGVWHHWGLSCTTRVCFASSSSPDAACRQTFINMKGFP